MKYPFTALAIIFLLITASGCDLLIAAMVCSEDYSVEVSGSCPADAPYHCSEDNSCYETYNDADQSCSEQADIIENECWGDYSDSDSGSSSGSEGGGSSTDDGTGDDGGTEPYGAGK